MTFSAQVKQELCKQPLNRRCCAQAEAYGILLFCNTFHSRQVRIITESPQLKRRLPVLFRKAFRLNFDQIPWEEEGKGTFLIEDPEKLRVIFAAFGLEADSAVSIHVNFAHLEEEHCQVAFLRGAFLAGGSVTDPMKGYHLELATSHYHVGREVPALLREVVAPAFLGLPAECWLHEDDQLVVLMDLPAGAGACPEELRAKLIGCAAEMRRRGGRVQVGLGDPVADWGETRHSFALAQEALTYRIYSPEVEIYDSSLIASQRSAFSRDSIDFAPLIDAILEHDEEGIRTYCDAFFQALLYIQMPPPSFVVGMCMYLVLNTQKRIQERQPERPPEISFSYEELNNYESLEEMRRWLCDFFTRYSQLLKDSDASENRIIRTAKDYIRDNLSRNLKAKDVAAQVNLSEAYFTIYFKEKTGVNFRDYLLGARIDQAKRLLRSGAANISEVAYRTGYQDYRSFSRAFKHETGMTPSEYQNQCRQEDKPAAP